MEHISIRERAKPLRKQKICRTCMSKESNWADERNQSVLFLSINQFPPDDEIMEMSKLLVRVIPEITYNLTDEMPQRICFRCLEKLSEIERFQQMCITSEFEFRCVLDSVMFVEKYFGKRQEDLLEYYSDDLEEHDFVKLNIKDNTELMQNVDQNCKEFPVEDDSVNKLPIPSTTVDQINLKMKDDSLTQTNELNDDSPVKFKCKTKEILSKSKKLEANINQLIAKQTVQLVKDTPLSPVTPVENYMHKCCKCARVFSELHFLNKHKLIHLEKRKRQVDKKNLTSTNCQSSTEEFTCKKCGKKFNTHNLLLEHEQEPCINSNKYDNNKSHVCNFCQKTFQQSCTLKNHIRTHTGEQPYLCSECGKAFKSSSNLKQHILRHSGEYRYECPDCPKKFPCSSDLASHRAVHMKIRPHVCDICGSAFIKPFQLKKHKMYHNGEKPHKCKYCEMRFVCADHMRRHMRTHTGERPYKCKFCVRAFTQSNDLVKHLRLHLGENVYQCELCPKAFRLATELRIHFADHKIKNKVG